MVEALAILSAKCPAAYLPAWTLIQEVTKIQLRQHVASLLVSGLTQIGSNGLTLYYLSRTFLLI